MAYFPCDIPFMSDEELKENGIKIPKINQNPMIDVYIYSLDLNVEAPSIKRVSGVIDTNDCYNPVKIAVGPNDWNVWHSEFDTSMLGVVYEPLDNIVELIVKRDGTSEGEAITIIEDYCSKKAKIFRKKLRMFYRGICAAIQFRLFKTIEVIRPGSPPISREEYLRRASFSAPIDITDDRFDGDPVLIIPGPFEGEEDI